MDYRMVNIRDYPETPLTDYSKARNHFLKGLPNNEYVLFVEEDEEVPRMLLDYIDDLPPRYPYYCVRRLNLLDNRYVPLWNPFHVAKLCSNKMRFIRKVHEVPEDTQHRGWQRRCGWIDIPTIHNQLSNEIQNGKYPTAPWFRTRLFHPLQAILKIREVLRGY